MTSPVFKSAFHSSEDEFSGQGKRPVVFDIIGFDGVTSLLPEGLKLVLHVNPSSLSFTYSNNIQRAQTLGGFVEWHWGSLPTEVQFEASTGGFMRLYTGLSAVTGPGPSNDQILPKSAQAQSATIGGGGYIPSRRETIAYDKYLDLLALFHNNGAIYDRNGRIILQGQIKMSFDGGVWYGWFSSFSVSESADTPYQFKLSAGFTVEREEHTLRAVSGLSNPLVGEVPRSENEVLGDFVFPNQSPAQPPVNPLVTGSDVIT